MPKLFHMIAALVAAVTATLLPQSEQARSTVGPAALVVVAPPPAPADLADQIQALGSQFHGQAGIAVRDVEGGWTAAYDGQALFPQQSVSKLWVALATFEAIDRGQTRLDEPVLITRNDLSVFHQPIRARVRRDGYTATVDELLFDAIAKSDNAANDMLMRRAGGGEAVQEILREKGLRGIRAGTEERLLQAKIAGMNWRQEYSVDWNFQHARELLPDAYRKANLDAYIADPPDGASPAGIVDALARLQKGRLLSRTSTDHFLDIMDRTVTGRSRLTAGLPRGWTIKHKTGTGQELGARVTGWNDVGLLTSPDGRTYAVAVMIADTTASTGARVSLFQKVARAIVAHDARAPDAPAQKTAGRESASIG